MEIIPRTSDASTDPYRTRTTRTELAPRADPVLHGTATNDTDLEALADRFERRGFIEIPGLFSSEEVRGWRVDAERAAEEVPAGSYVVQEPGHEPGREHVRSVFRIHATVESFRRLARDTRVLRVVRRILGEGVYVHQSRINYKAALVGREFQWHSDFETWHAEDGMPRARALSAVLMLTESTDCNGPLMVIPGSHRTFVRCAGETPKNHHLSSLRQQDYGVPDPDSLLSLAEEGGLVNVTGPPGTLVLFDCNTMHASNANLSPWPRTSLFYVYNSVDNQLGEPFAGCPPRPEFLAARELVDSL